ncbi:MAG: hypothetical protein LBD44_02020 [Spirochaetaceae bacterium]|jgi:hypothetical protein|nr:hypothetical protein [Spirochaetaceae bacterium]
MNKRIAVCFGLLLPLLFPYSLPAQNFPAREGYDYEGKAVTALLPFIGDEESAAAFNRAVAQAVANLAKYSCRVVTAETVGAAGVKIPTDMPPVRELIPGARYAITGGVYPGSYEGEYYLQLWLWDVTGSTMIYTDDLVYRNIEAGLEDLPGLVDWLFSHIVERTVVAEPEVKKAWDDKLIYAGLRSGASSHWYTAPEEIVPGAHSLNYEGGIFISARFNSLISLQAEIDFIWDDLVYRGIKNTSSGGHGTTYSPVLENERYRSFSLLFPVLFKLNFRPGIFRLAPYGGLFAVAPLGKTLYRANPVEEEDSFSRSNPTPLGLTVGFEIATRLGPGIILADIRYSGDFGKTTINNAAETSYKRGMASFTLGYALGFIDIKK